MTGIDLFGNAIEEKDLTSTQRMVSRQAVLTGRDLYTTEPKDIRRFIEAIKRDGVNLVSPIWEPAAGQGDISKTLIEYGYEVISTDIFPYKDSEIEVFERDFFACNSPADFFDKAIGCIFTNPPFNAQEEFLKLALSFDIDVVFFVRLSFLSSIRRLKIYEKYNPAYVYVYSARAHCYKNGNTSHGQNMIDYCIIMWKPPYKNETVLRWII
jgi:hypothetical protein